MSLNAQKRFPMRKMAKKKHTKSGKISHFAKATANENGQKGSIF